MRKSAVLSFSVTVEPAEALFLQPVGHLLGRAQSRFSSGRNEAMSRSKVFSADTLLLSRSGSTARSSMPRGKPRQPLALGAVAAHQVALVGALQVGDQCGSRPWRSGAAATLPTP